MIDATDRRLLTATQGGLPLVTAPYAEVAGWLDLSEAEVIERFHRMIEAGIVRRIAVAPNHYALGMVANGMSVWDVDDRDAATLGQRIGALAFVSHCYLRPRAEGWPYNLFAMIHGDTRDAVENHRSKIAELLGQACRQNDILYSTRILKKTGMRLKQEG